MGGGAAEPGGAHHPAPQQDEAPHRDAVRQPTERQVSQGDPQDHRGDGIRSLGRADPEFHLQYRQHRLGEIDITDGRGHQAKNHGLQAPGAAFQGAPFSFRWVVQG